MSINWISPEKGNRYKQKTFSTLETFAERTDNHWGLHQSANIDILTQTEDYSSKERTQITASSATVNAKRLRNPNPVPI